MPLRDHFRSPVADKRPWNEFFAGWPAMMVQDLFRILPEGFRSAPAVCHGSKGETDIPEQDEFEVRVYDTRHGRRLVAAIELVSPRNKDRPESRRAFVGKVATLLQKDVCVSIVDLVSIGSLACTRSCWRSSGERTRGSG